MNVFFPSKEIESTPASINLSFEDVYIVTKDNVTIHGWYIPGKNSSFMVLFCHGNASNISNRLDKIAILHDIGVSILIIDYRGYGKSQGKPTEAGIYLDAEAAYDYLINTRAIKAKQLILYGESLGGVAAINLASKVTTAAIITEGVFSSGRDMGKILYPSLPSFIFSHKFYSLDKIKRIPIPKLFIHSRDDEVVPFSLARKLYNAAYEPKKFVEIKGSHNQAFLESREIFTDAIASFVKKLH